MQCKLQAKGETGPHSKLMCFFCRIRSIRSRLRQNKQRFFSSVGFYRVASVVGVAGAVVDVTRTPTKRRAMKRNRRERIRKISR